MGPERKPADETLRQLGGSNRIRVMTGAKKFLSDNQGKTLCFQFEMCPAANYVRITLEDTDLYTVRFLKIGNFSRKTMQAPVTEVKVFEMIGVERLGEVFSEFTGLALTLGAMS